jgi:FtsP/CotA-like multicopper oxidase with cupredoxin domain
MSYISKRNRSKEREMENAAKNRREIIAARLSRRDLMKMGLLTSAGLLIPKRGLSARALNSAGEPTLWMASPPATPYVEPLFIPPIAQPVASLSPAPTAAPNTGAGEGRTRIHQAFTQFPPQKYYEVHQREALISVHPDFPLQRLWTFNGTVPGQTYVAQYGQPILVRNFNDLPNDNGGFGLQSVSTHLHNGHTPSESDGFPCDFFEQGHFYDQHYPNVLAGFSTPPHAPNGDINESMSTLWYHDHRVDFTAQNVYKGLAGFYLLFNNKDTGNETTGFRLPSFPDFDIPMIFNDKNFNADEILVFDLANRDGILGDRFLVNGKIQPFFNVKRRKYRFRWLNGGPSRFYQFYITKQDNTNHPFYVIANDGNLLPFSVLTSNGVRIAVAERMDVIVDFSSFAAGTKLYINNRLEQLNGAGPTDNILSASQGNKVLEFRVVSDTVNDQSVNPATITRTARNGIPYFYSVPARETEDITRCFDFDRQDGEWVINGQVFGDCEDVRFKVKRGNAEIWELQGGRDWQHPIHIHFEEHQVIERNRNLPIEIERGRKDVIRLGDGDDVKLFFRFRDFVGRYPMHCHNTIHEDHAMMLRFDIDDVGNTNENCSDHNH